MVRKKKYYGLKARDLEVLRYRRRNANAQHSDIGRELDIPTTSVWEIYKKLMRKRFIRSEVTHLNWKKLGYSYHVFFTIRKYDSDLLRYLDREDAVNGYWIEDAFEPKSVMLEMYFENTDSIDAFGEVLKHFDCDFQQFVVGDEVKRDCFVPEIWRG